MEGPENRNISLLTDEFLVRVDDVEFRVRLADPHRVVIDGEEYAIDYETTSPARALLMLARHPYEISVAAGADRSEFQVNVEGHAYRVFVDDRRSLLQKTLFERRAGKRKSETVRAPMPGMVLRVEVAAGASVRPGDGLVVLEAMKMENEIRAVDHGTVDAIRVSPGSVVEKGQELLSIVQA